VGKAARTLHTQPVLLARRKSHVHEDKGLEEKEIGTVMLVLSASKADSPSGTFVWRRFGCHGWGGSTAGWQLVRRVLEYDQSSHTAQDCPCNKELSGSKIQWY